MCHTLSGCSCFLTSRLKIDISEQRKYITHGLEWPIGVTTHGAVDVSGSAEVVENATNASCPVYRSTLSPLFPLAVHMMFVSYRRLSQRRAEPDRVYQSYGCG